MQSIPAETHPSFSRPKQALCLRVLVCLLSIVAGPSSVWAANHFVSPTGVDVAPCTNAAPCQTIAFALSQATNNDKIRLSAGVFQENSLLVNKDVVIDGRGPGNTIIDAQGVSRIFYIASPATRVRIRDMALQNGDASGALVLGCNGIAPAGAGCGGAILIDGAGDVLIQNTRLRNNIAWWGGAISHESDSTLTIKNTSFLNNESTENGGALYCDGCGTIQIRRGRFSDNIAGTSGGAIYSRQPGTEDTPLIDIRSSRLSGNEAASFGGAIDVNGLSLLRIRGSTLSDNSVIVGDGGAISTSGSLLVVARTTIAHNTAGPFGSGGGISVQDGEASFNNCTLSGNEAFSGGGLDIEGPAAIVAVANCTLSGNISTNFLGTGGGAFLSTSNNFTLDNSILTKSTGGDCSGTLPAGTNNLIDDATCGAAPFNLGPVTNFDLNLQNNGGPTNTHQLFVGSNAIDAGANSCPDPVNGNPLPSDQRGVSRPQGGTCDTGAVEF